MLPLAILGLATALCAAQEAGIPWSSELVRKTELWIQDANDSSISGTAAGLRIAVKPGQTWRIAAASDVRLPKRVRTIRVRVAEASNDARWLMRVYGDLRSDDKRRTVGFFQSERRSGEVTLRVDPRLLPRDGRPLQVQLGLEGEPGSHVIFESLEFVPGDDSLTKSRPGVQKGQRDIECVTLMPNLPQPFEMKDWNSLARAYDAFVFDFESKGQYLPLIWLDDSRINVDRPGFGLPSYVGDSSRSSGSRHESITCMGAVLGATIAGIDKRRQRHDYVLMCEAYFNEKNGQRLVLNGINGHAGGSFWYEIWPHVVFYALADRYPDTGRLEGIVKTTADRWSEACLALGGREGTPDFDHTSFDFRTMRAVDNGKWREPDAAAGVAWLEYMAWKRHGEKKYLAAADGCMQFLEERRHNPYYEVLLPYGALTAARMNAELGRNYDIHKLIDWCFGISDCRGGWGVIATNWSGYDCHGLLGSVDNRGGYAFAMNTFAQAAALVPLVRYDDRYARAIGKWMLNLANAARLFYPRQLPEGHESCPGWKGDPRGLIAYEGLRCSWDGKGPYATGDPVVMNWGSPTDLGLYGSSYAGLLGGIVRTTDEEAVLQLDCLATDFYRSPAYPTFLYYNPHGVTKSVAIEVGDSPCDIYDACTDSFLKRDVGGSLRISIQADSAVLAVLVPSGKVLKRDRWTTVVDDVVIDYRPTTP